VAFGVDGGGAGASWAGRLDGGIPGSRSSKPKCPTWTLRGSFDVIILILDADLTVAHGTYPCFYAVLHSGLAS
jgi:hypothetical protein